MRTHFQLFLSTVLLLLIACIYSCHVGRFFVYNLADVRDHRKFPARTLTAPAEEFHFYTADHELAPKQILDGKDSMSFDTYLSANKTVAFLIIRNDSILYEKYFDGYDQSSVVPSFSVAKSVTSLLIGCALDDGLIRSVDEKMIAYVPELKNRGFEEVTIRHLLQMSSGLDFNEGYFNPFGDVAKFYYGRNLHHYLTKMKAKGAPGKRFEYLSGNTQLLGLVLERALKGTTITDYFQQKIWSQLGMEYDASWSLDKKNGGMEKTFCCINAVARDFAKIGRLYLNNGNWNGRRIISESWVKESTSSKNGPVPYYGYQWWIPSQGSFMAQGILGQYIFVDPSKNMIIVRLGRNYGDVNWWHFLPQLASSF